MRDRRDFLRSLGAALGASLLGVSCGGARDAEAQDSAGRPGHLGVRPRRPVRTARPGRSRLGLGTERDGELLIPASHRPEAAAPLVLALHGAGGSSAGPLAVLAPLAEEHGVVVLAAESRGPTWDAIRGDYGPDVAFLGRALAAVFEQVHVDPARVILEGFSDGASYALGLGLANGDLFAGVAAFSPGFIPPGAPPSAVRPPVFISHGRSDEILPIDRTSQRIVPQLRGRGYDVTYEEYDGGHRISPEIARQGVAWMLERRLARAR